MEFLGKGTRGIVHTVERDGVTVVVKEPNPEAAVDTIAHEAAILQKVNKKGIGPTFIALENNKLVREYIDGEEILDWVTEASTKDLKRVLRDLLDQCRTLDEMGLSKGEMTRPYKHILVRNNRPIQIDFERATDTKKPKNVTQFCQWLTNSRMTSLLETHGIVLDTSQVRKLAKTYKELYTQGAYEAIRKFL